MRTRMRTKSWRRLAEYMLVDARLQHSQRERIADREGTGKRAEGKRESLVGTRCVWEGERTSERTRERYGGGRKTVVPRQAAVSARLVNGRGDRARLAIARQPFSKTKPDSHLDLSHGLLLRASAPVGLSACGGESRVVGQQPRRVATLSLSHPVEN